MVLGHVAYILLDLAGAPWAAGAPPVWNDVDVVLRPLRMPLFFAISGLFAAGALTRPWRVTLRPRVVQNLYLHVLWLLIGFAVSTAVSVPTFMAPERLRDVPLRRPRPRPASGTCTRWPSTSSGPADQALAGRGPRRAAAALAVVSFCGVLPGSGDTHSVVENLVWFLAGARFPDALRSLSARQRPCSWWGSAACWCSCWPPSASSTRPSSSPRSSRSPRAQPRSWSASAWPCC